MNKRTGSASAPTSIASPCKKTLTVFGTDANDAIFEMLVSVTVGIKRYHTALSKYRILNKRFKQETDTAIDVWCTTFQRLANAQRDAQLTPGHQLFTQPSLVTGSGDDSERLLYKMQTMVVSAFGHNHPLTERYMALVSILNRHVYLHMLTRTCCICHKPVSPPTLGDIDLPFFNYTYAHKECQLRHCVRIKDATKRGTDEAKLQYTGVYRDSKISESAAHVLLGCKLEGKTRNVSEVRIKKKLGKRYCQFVNKGIDTESASEPLLVWLSPHPAIRDDETLYGILDIDEETEQRATKLAKEHFCRLRERAKQAKLESLKKREMQNAQNESRIQAMLAHETRANAYLRCIRDVEAVHPDAYDALHLCLFIDDQHFRLTQDNMQRIITSIDVLEEVLVLLKGFANKSLILDWLFSHHAKMIIWDAVWRASASSKSEIWYMKNKVRDIALPIVRMLKCMHTNRCQIRVFDTQHRTYHANPCRTNLETGIVDYNVKIMWIPGDATTGDQVSESSLEDDVDETKVKTFTLDCVSMLDRDLSMMRWGFYEALEGLSERDEIPVRDVDPWKFQGYVSALLELAMRKHLISRLHPFLCQLLGLNSGVIKQFARSAETCLNDKH
tara:strand:+ start:2143 stop:3987 length:1845 start_codon:yes stop_codon:yes gene_type:complete